MKWTNNEKNKIAQLVTIGLTDKEVAKHKLHKLGKTKLTAADAASAEFVSRFNAKSLL